jgi:hypothetical protein
VATTVAVLEAKLRADTRDFDRAMGRSETKMGKFGKVAGAAALGAGAAVAYGLGKVAKIGWDEFNQGQAVAAQTNAVLKSTGGIANVSAKHVDDLGRAMMLKSGVDDEVIKSGANVLLTFTNIRNEAGKGNQVFDDATQAALDLSVAMGKDMNSSSVLVGKALNDPIKGLSALTRVGVTFSDKQKDQIKTLMESGKKMKAQKLILAELRKEFGGSAEAAGKTFGGQINILRERFNNWAGDMVAKAIPMLQRLYEWFNDKVAPIIRDVAGEVMPLLRTAIGEIADAIRENEPQLREIWENISVAIRTMWRVARPILRVLFTVVIPRFINIAITYVNTYVRVIAKIITAVRAVVDWFRSSFLPGVRRVWDAIRDKVATVADFIRDRVNARLERVRAVFALVRATAKFTWEFIRDKTQIVVDKVQKVIDKVNSLIRTLRRLWEKARGWLSDIGGWLGNLVPRVPSRSDFGGFGGGMVGPGSLGAVSSIASQSGLTMTSGFRPGDPGWHGQNRARDYAGSASQMVRFARLIAGMFGPSLLELIHTPLGYGIKNGRRVANSFFGSAVMADHYDHVHVAMNRGGVVPGRRGAPVPVLAHGGETFIPTHRGGGAAIGNTIINLPPGSYIYDPEGLLRLIERASKMSGRRGGPRLNFGT